MFLIDSAWVTGAWRISVYRAALHTMIDFMNFEVNGCLFAVRPSDKCYVKVLNLSQIR